MTFSIKNLALTATFAAATAVAPHVASAQYGSQHFTVVNNSRYRISSVYVSPETSTVWGRDRLGSQILRTDYRMDLAVDPGWYDVKLVDQDGDTCVLRGMDFRSGDNWTITDAVLLACEVVSSR